MKTNRFLSLLLSVLLLGRMSMMAWASTEHTNIIHMASAVGDCANPGRREYWHCDDEGCGKYFADAELTQEISLSETFTQPPAPHSYGDDGLCAVCGDEKKSLTFVKYDQRSYSSGLDGMLFVFVAFHEGKAYAMGNRTLPDGSREAVPLSVKETGAIDADSEMAEFFAFDYDGAAFCPDGGYMTAADGKIWVYDEERQGEVGLPGGIQFSVENQQEASGCLWWYTPSGDDKYIVFDAETLTFRPCATASDGIVRYIQLCAHENISHTPAVEPACTQQGTEEYWYCADCSSFYQNHNFEMPVQPEEAGGWVTAQSFTTPALGHSYDAGGVCQHCGMMRPVYSQISTLEAFDALSEDASYILVIKDGDKTYAAFLPDYNNFKNPCDIDSDGDGIVDALQMDANGNAIPDCIEILFLDWCNCDMDGDGDIDDGDYRFFIADFVGSEVTGMEAYKLFLEYNYWDVSMIYESRFLDVPNFVEVTMAADGTTTLTDEGAMEFQMMAAGVWGGAPYSEEGLEHFGILDSERICAAWIPNYWIGNTGTLGYYGEGHFASQNRTYGDGERPGIQDHKNWKISFNVDGSVCMVATWENYSNSGALQMVKYADEQGNEKTTLVGLPEWLWKDSTIMENRTDRLSVYLYASEPVYGHIHSWDAGVQNKAPTCTEEGRITYTCTDCGESDTRQIPATGEHTFGQWEVITEPTAKESGLRQRVCQHCGHTQQESIEPLGVLLGDVNGDGKVNARDARTLLRFLAGLVGEEEVDLTAADLNADGRVNVRDARAILRQIAGLKE